jgi:hypothetical protein
MMDFYVYAYLRPDDLTPYYIGKGRGNRHICRHSVPVPKDRSRIVFLEKNLTETGALALERRYIRWYGRKNVGTGILRNLTDGGEGSTGRVITDEFRVKMTMANLGKKRTDASKRRMSQSQLNSPNHSTRGKKRPDFAVKVAGSNNPMFGTVSPMRGKTHVVLTCPHCNKQGGGGAMKRFHFDMCKQLISTPPLP